MARELLNKDGSPMREYHSEIIEELLNEPKQSSVEFLTMQLIKNGIITYEDLKQARAMEKEQIEHSYLTCYEEYTAEGKHWEMGMNPKETFEQYYNETYKGGNNE